MDDHDQIGLLLELLKSIIGGDLQVVRYIVFARCPKTCMDALKMEINVGCVNPIRPHIRCVKCHTLSSTYEAVAVEARGSLLSSCNVEDQ